MLYGGALGGLATDYLQSVGGLITLDDLRGYRTAHSEGVTGNYRGCRIIGPAPPSAGGVHVVEMLNILEGFDIAAMGFGTADSLHLIAEALKLGFEDRREFMGDPAFVDVPMARLTSAEHAAERRALVSLKSARDVDMSYDAESNHTTHLTTADADGNVVAATHTLHAPFGSKLTVPGTGMLLNNTMNIFDPHPGLANSIAPGKRMTSSMSPVIVERKGRAWFALGSVGGTRIFPSVFQAIVNVIDFGMSAQESVEAPRIWTLGEDLDVEHAVADDVRTELARRGHRVVPHQVIGAGMGMIMFDQDHDDGCVVLACRRHASGARRAVWREPGSGSTSERGGSTGSTTDDPTTDAGVARADRDCGVCTDGAGTGADNAPWRSRPVPSRS